MFVVCRFSVLWVGLPHRCAVGALWADGVWGGSWIG